MNMPAKRQRSKNGSASSKKAQLTEELGKKGPMKLRKHAISVLSIPTQIVDNWNDYDFMIAYCVAKELGEPLPREPMADVGEDPPEDNGEATPEFDASGLVDNDDGEKEDNDDGAKSNDYDDEMESDGDDMFGGGQTEAAEETAPEPAPPAPPRRLKRRNEPTDVGGEPERARDLAVTVGHLLDVITNQGAILGKLVDSAARQESMLKELYLRQEATHSGLSTVAKTVFSTSAILSGFYPRALKAMRFKPSAAKEIRSQADSAMVAAEELINSLLDPEVD